MRARQATSNDPLSRNSTASIPCSVSLSSSHPAHGTTTTDRHRRRSRLRTRSTSTRSAPPNPEVSMRCRTVLGRDGSRTGITHPRTSGGRRVCGGPSLDGLRDGVDVGRDPELGRDAPKLYWQLGFRSPVAPKGPIRTSTAAPDPRLRRLKCLRSGEANESQGPARFTRP